MNRESEAGSLAYALDQSIGAVGREWTAALGRKDVARVRELPAKAAKAYRTTNTGTLPSARTSDV